MKITVEDQSQTLKGTPYVSGGKIKLEFKCIHPFGSLQFSNGEVLCRDCDNKDMTGEQEVMFLQAEADLRHSVDEDRAIQDSL